MSLPVIDLSQFHKFVCVCVCVHLSGNIDFWSVGLRMFWLDDSLILDLVLCQR